MQRAGMVRNQSYVCGDLKRDLPTLFWFQTSQRSCQSASYQLVLPQPDLTSSNLIMPSRLLCCIKFSCARNSKMREYACLVTENLFPKLFLYFNLLYLSLSACLSLTLNQCFLPVCLAQTLFLMLQGQCEHSVG